ncbi:class I SAM-dependent methyltransferase [Planctomyces sp. SH-PL62]|uniref:class I SAM-dependent methyltransferase n=1 Tax=Planctomyces sp. SH-PL62 TaxID=1636152 RepID=UPI00078E1E47|nr:class I SAM-dependent methyltransferase [Planctomyces sp. SH-PL62]AMV39848.1 Ubiquinone biosynthesis O-methyltransferase [Planctomyces sp. SH-PL62]
MISAHEAEVTFRFDALHWRFKDSVDPEDYRLRGVLDAIGPVEGLRVLDLGCGKGRFSRALQQRGAIVAGVDVSTAMLAEAEGIDRVRGSARSLPFRSASFDAIIAVEVFEHLDPASWSGTIAEARRVLAPRGTLAIVDKSLASFNAQRPWMPSALVKMIDERRGMWMYPSDGPARERWFWPSRLRKELRKSFSDVRVVHLLSPSEQRRMLFRKLPAARLMALWVARGDGGSDV